MMYLGPQLFCFSSLLFRLALRHGRLFRFGACRIVLLCRVWVLVGGAIPRLVYQHALRRTLTVRAPRAEDVRLDRFERRGFSRSTELGFVRGVEERRVCGFGRVIRRSGVRGRDRG